MSVRLKTILVVIVILLLSTGGLYIASRAILLRSLEQAERSLAQQELNQIASIFSKDIEDLTRVAKSWSINSAIIKLVNQQDGAPFESDPIWLWVSSEEIDFFGVYDTSGSQLLEAGNSTQTDKWEETPGFVSTSELQQNFQMELTQSCQNGVFRRLEDHYIFSSCPVPSFKDPLQGSGFLIVARNLLKTELTRLKGQSGRDIQFIPYAELSLSLIHI